MNLSPLDGSGTMIANVMPDLLVATAAIGLFMVLGMVILVLLLAERWLEQRQRLAKSRKPQLSFAARSSVLLEKITRHKTQLKFPVTNKPLLPVLRRAV